MAPAITSKDFVSYDECKKTAEDYLDLHNSAARTVLAPQVIDFAIVLAANVAYECATMATRRAKG